MCLSLLLIDFTLSEELGLEDLRMSELEEISRVARDARDKISKTLAMAKIAEAELSRSGSLTGVTKPFGVSFFYTLRF